MANVLSGEETELLSQVPMESLLACVHIVILCLILLTLYFCISNGTRMWLQALKLLLQIALLVLLCMVWSPKKMKPVLVHLPRLEMDTSVFPDGFQERWQDILTPVFKYFSEESLNWRQYVTFTSLFPSVQHSDDSNASE